MRGQHDSIEGASGDQNVAQRLLSFAGAELFGVRLHSGSVDCLLVKQFVGVA